MLRERLTVFVVDDDPGVRDSLALMLGLRGFRTAAFADAEALLDAWRGDWSGCVVADLRLPRMSGVELQAALRGRGSTLPFVVITAHGDVASARAAFRAEALDFLEKPFDEEQLLAAIEKAFALELRRLGDRESREADATLLDSLTPRERKVMELAARGLHAKEIARTLAISPRTVEVHKSRLMAKLGVRNVAQLVRFALTASRNERSS